VLTNYELDRNIEDLTDTEIYAAIRYLEPDPRIEDKQDADDQDKDKWCRDLHLFTHSTGTLPILLVVLLVRPEMTMIGGSWNPATISALAAIFGSLTGALASSVSTWITQTHQGRRDILAKRIFYREQLYSDFISKGAHALADAAQHHLQDPNSLSPTYALLSRMRLSSSTDVLASAERVIQYIITAYSEPNLTPEEIQRRVAKREDP
jgi:hypothetical protein